ncbi:hypothetical protein ES288_A09G211600v1 [Gossypium darwinii]|uniref:Uncharacterized protein n=1 Tax=Gossypium darwinii TaxID=34276 RepID=A0A5D2FD12_GOSDA|nr:hypothetical protein ES288_A09G211600v1 [Gossypium darwinii]
MLLEVERNLSVLISPITSSKTVKVHIFLCIYLRITVVKEKRNIEITFLLFDCFSILVCVCIVLFFFEYSERKKKRKCPPLHSFFVGFYGRMKYNIFLLFCVVCCFFCALHVSFHFASDTGDGTGLGGGNRQKDGHAGLGTTADSRGKD